MKIEQIYTGCLAQGAYYIESAGEAVVIDPLRETQPYLDRAAASGAKITYILETHFHADFVSGHVDLASKTGAKIVYGPGAKTEFDTIEAKHKQELKIGDVSIVVLHTPGHTLESSTYLLRDENGKDHALFSGDTLFIGDVGRPDLAQKMGALTQDDLAGMLFDSLRTEIMPLADDILVYPAHGAGSACGKNMSSETWDTLGNQKSSNYALRADMTRKEFIAEVTDGLLPPPQYFAKNVAMNKQGISSLDSILSKGNVGQDVDTFEAMANHDGALLLDTRTPAEFMEGHVPGSIFIGVDGNFAPWVGALITDLTQPILFIANEGREEEVVTRLSRVGYDNTIGFLKGGITAWRAAGKELDTVANVLASALPEIMAQNQPILDVRKPGEFAGEHIQDAINMPLDYINDNMEGIDSETPYHVHCAGGYRSVIFASILKARGFHNMINIEGGWKEIEKVSAIATTDFVCPSTLK